METTQVPGGPLRNCYGERNPGKPKGTEGPKMLVWNIEIQGRHLQEQAETLTFMKCADGVSFFRVIRTELRSPNKDPTL